MTKKKKPDKGGETNLREIELSRRVAVLEKLLADCKYEAKKFQYVIMSTLNEYLQAGEIKEGKRFCEHYLNSIRKMRENLKPYIEK
jgi:hypothetical protein